MSFYIDSRRVISECVFEFNGIVEMSTELGPTNTCTVN